MIFPALAIDLITQRTTDKNLWLNAGVYSTAFLGIFLMVQWPFGDFLMSESARNWVFGTESWYFGSRPDWEYRYAYAEWMESTGLELIKGLAIALGVGFLSARLAIQWGMWMNKVVR